MGKFNLNQILNDASKRAAPGGGGQTAPASRAAEIERLSVFDLVPSEDNFYSMNDIEELKGKIELAGKVLQNFIVVPLGGGKYKVISGHRRRAACISLVEDGKPEFEFVPCTIEADEEDAEVQKIREEIMLIAANSQREKTAWDKIEETRRTRALLEKIKQQEKLPGDMRKLVAQTLNTSPAQIGRFDAIMRNLCPEFMEELKAERINISTAYELSGLSAEDQQAAFERYQETGDISIKAARERKQEPPPVVEVQTAQNSSVSAEERQERTQAAPQPAAEPPEEERREEVPPMQETPTEGRTEPQESKKPEEMSAASPAPPGRIETIEEEPPKAIQQAEVIEWLGDLCSFCMDMAERWDDSREWGRDVQAIMFAIEKLEGRDDG